MLMSVTSLGCIPAQQVIKLTSDQTNYKNKTKQKQTL